MVLKPTEHQNFVSNMRLCFCCDSGALNEPAATFYIQFFSILGSGAHIVVLIYGGSFLLNKK